MSGKIERIIITPYDPAAETGLVARVALSGYVLIRQQTIPFEYDVQLVYADQNILDRALNLGEAEDWVSVREYRHLSLHLKRWIERWFPGRKWPSKQWLSAHGFGVHISELGAYLSIKQEEFITEEES